MLTPLEISFHGIERSEAVETRIHEKFKRLETQFDRITHARVAIEVPRRRTERPKLFHVRIEIGIPGHKPILAHYEPPSEESGRSDIRVALREAFAVAQRQLSELTSRLDHPAKHERTRRRPRPAVEQEHEA